MLFLDAHDDRAWKAVTIAERLELEADAVSAILLRLKERGLVRHKRPYWARSRTMRNSSTLPIDATDSMRWQTNNGGRRTRGDT